MQASATYARTATRIVRDHINDYTHDSADIHGKLYSVARDSGHNTIADAALTADGPTVHSRAVMHATYELIKRINTYLDTNPGEPVDEVAIEIGILQSTVERQRDEIVELHELLTQTAGEKLHAETLAELYEQHLHDNEIPLPALDDHLDTVGSGF